MDISKTLAKRGKLYGSFNKQADISQALKRVMKASPNWESLEPIQKEALEMTAHKIARILNGDHRYIDSWHDITGYIKLVEEYLDLNNPWPGSPI